MKYFTPELYVQGNSSSEDLVDRAEAEWERACTRYKRHYRKIQAKLPARVRRFHDEYCLHDADVLGPAWLSDGHAQGQAAEIVLVVQNENTLSPEHVNTLMFLHYTVVEEPRIEIPVPSAVFGDVQPIWLYDELDVVRLGVYQHEILLSNGRVLQLRFRSFDIQTAPLVMPTRALHLRNREQHKAVSA